MPASSTLLRNFSTLDIEDDNEKTKVNSNLVGYMWCISSKITDKDETYPLPEERKRNLIGLWKLAVPGLVKSRTNLVECETAHLKGVTLLIA